MTAIDESMQYLRSDIEGGCLYSLFANVDVTESTPIDAPRQKLQWSYPCVFSTVMYTESLECVHARRRAFGGSTIEFAKPPDPPLPERCLLSKSDAAVEVRLNALRVRWIPRTVFEVPAYCIGTLLTARGSVDWNLPPGDYEMHKAATKIKPARYDVVGVFTSDSELAGAVEFAEHIEGDDYLACLMATIRNGRRLCVGDKLYGRYSGLIGNTPIAAECCLFEVLEVSE